MDFTPYEVLSEKKSLFIGWLTVDPFLREKLGKSMKFSVSGKKRYPQGGYFHLQNSFVRLLVIGIFRRLHLSSQLSCADLIPHPPLPHPSSSSGRKQVFFLFRCLTVFLLSDVEK